MEADMKLSSKGKIKLLLTAIIIIICSTGFTASHITTTQVAIFKAFVQHDNLNPNLIVTQRTSGNCWTQSLANSGRPDAWRCQTNTLIMDPCFQDNKTLACVVSPWVKKVSILELNSVLPETSVKKLNTQKAIPWALELTDGQRCTFLTGSTGAVNGMRINYGCSPDTHIIGDLDRSNYIWKAHEHKLGNRAIREVDVKKVWF
jgi:hypothetical protein